MRQRTYTTEGLVIRQFPLGEADRILTIFTQDMGKVRLVAKGVRRPKSKLGGHLELLYQVSFSAAYGRNLDVVNEAQTVQRFAEISEDLDRLSRAVYMCELVDSFSAERSASYSLYQHIIASLTALCSTDDTWLLVRHFEAQLLGVTGFRPELRLCVECGTDLAPADHVFDVSSGGVVCPNCQVQGLSAVLPVQLNAMKVLRLLQRERTFASVAGVRVTPPVRHDVERLLTTHIRYVVERALKSADFVRQVSEL
ncbi:MAG: DNA repair protein RecO [SAR202 cluster bacterium]|jgi:DNA repair protein RecO (recombination protein O)|nr:DNA repair protein RecO [SAR202 cluster bacterium]MDP6665518.1 DNA repair protein RecO [SAR202 cluster bacterium]MDP6799471.1 DNA repair protein RecO [SAR202 cluster bacterium]|tara:strand:- start:251 stop:1012 length:762 start_codon:yes stop_codon:yes gene_type:complete